MSAAPCYMQLATCGPVAAWLTTSPSANTVHLCRHCLDWWFDETDAGSNEEPLDWGWIRQPAVLTEEQIAAALTDPRNRARVSEVLRHESRRNPTWLREFLWREELRTRYRGFVRPR
ncbi:hypothetical protein ACFXKI_09645 [Streptomyces mirabilis]|uniref:hypothetical protein n=1 Tax=Streptomyces mirabilis TaxID=68239 RepID=UPI0036BB0BF2